MQITVCLPARWASTRLPGKLARLWRGRPVLAWTVEAALAAEIGPVCVLSDDPRLDAVATGARVIRIAGSFLNGSERIAEAIRRGLLGAPDIVVDLQADAVGATPAVLRAAVEALIADPAASLATVVVRTRRDEVIGRTTAAVAAGRALYFSRHPLPAAHADAAPVLAHIGVYAYRVPRLLELSVLAPGPLERAEGLEQLRWLENGDVIAVAVLPEGADLAFAVDSAADLVEPTEEHAPERFDGGR